MLNDILYYIYCILCMLAYIVRNLAFYGIRCLSISLTQIFLMGFDRCKCWSLLVFIRFLSWMGNTIRCLCILGWSISRIILLLTSSLILFMPRISSHRDHSVSGILLQKVEFLLPHALLWHRLNFAKWDAQKNWYFKFN